MWYFSKQIGISVDTKGNVEVQGSYLGGVSTGTPGASFTRYRTVANIPNVNKFNGPSYELGGSVADGLAIGADFNIIPDEDLNKTYLGVTVNGGIATPGGEVHVGWGETTPIFKIEFNLYEFIDKMYVRIMEW